MQAAESLLRWEYDIMVSKISSEMNKGFCFH